MAIRKRLLLLSTVLAAGAGCKAAWQARDPEFPQVAYAAHQALRAQVSAQAAVDPVVDELAGPHRVEDYLQFALSQNAGVQAARKRVDAAAMRVPQAASLKDPQFSANAWPFYPYVPQTAAGRVTNELMISQEVPWKGKLQAQSQAALAELDMARARLAAAELQVIEQVKLGYYQLYYSEQSLRITEENRKLLADVLEIANARYVTGKTSQQDILRLQAELSTIDAELVQARQQIESDRADLAGLLHVSPDTPFATTGQLDAEEVPRNLEALYQQAVVARPELHEQLAEIRRDRFQVDRARLDYYPDLTYGAQWGMMTRNRALALAADGVDMVGLNVSLNLPVYRKRINAGVREAEASVVASSREFDSLRDQTLRDVKSLFAEAQSQQEVAALLRESIIPKTEQALEVSINEYEVGTTEFVQMIDNWRSLLRVQLLLKRTESQLRQTLASLERTVGGFTTAQAEPTPEPVRAPTAEATE
ncbi:MAG: TolC family protein [Aureliella sp.]